MNRNIDAFKRCSVTE